jgi:hypothetical protein
MSAIGFKEYNDRDRYKARRALNKTTNLIWKLTVTALVIVGIVYVCIFLKPWQKEVNSAINHPARYEGVPSFWR